MSDFWTPLYANTDDSERHWRTTGLMSVKNCPVCVELSRSDTREECWKINVTVTVPQNVVHECTFEVIIRCSKNRYILCCLFLFLSLITRGHRGWSSAVSILCVVYNFMLIVSFWSHYMWESLYVHLWLFEFFIKKKALNQHKIEDCWPARQTIWYRHASDISLALADDSLCLHGLQ